MHPIERRFWLQVEETKTCWLWIGAKNKLGYGQFTVSNSPPIYIKELAHRFAWQLTKGRIPEGLVLDHHCKVPACVNPLHLEPVTQKENILRGQSLTAINARKTVCKRGHVFDDTNTYHYKNRSSRACRKCAAMHSRQYKAIKSKTEVAA